MLSSARTTLAGKVVLATAKTGVGESRRVGLHRQSVMRGGPELVEIRVAVATTLRPLLLHIIIEYSGLPRESRPGFATPFPSTVLPGGFGTIRSSSGT